MMSFFRSVQAFFFAENTALGFGWMRSSWAAVTLLFLLFQWNEVALFYSNDGLLPWGVAETVLRSDYQYTLFRWITSGPAVFGVYLTLLGFLVLMMLGIVPRLTTIISVVLLFSFHERNTMVMAGGDTLLRALGFLLMIAPGTTSFSLFSWTKAPRLRSSVWPYRLLLWQMIILYGTSFWYKTLGALWQHGSAVEIALHHPVFARWPGWFVTLLTPVMPVIDWISLGWEGLWILLLVPRWLTDLLPPQLPRIPFKRMLMIGGVFFHLGIFLMMDAGSFSLVMLTAYLGLLQDEDIRWLKRIFRPSSIRSV